MNFESIAKYSVVWLLVILSVQINAQKKRWALLYKGDLKETFIDSSSVKISDDQISVWVLEIFDVPRELDVSGLKAKRARTQYLFDIARNNYSIIGNLYYDEVGKIISQKYNPRIGGVGRAFYEEIDGNPIVNKLYTALTEYLDINVQRPQLDLATSNTPEQFDELTSMNNENSTDFVQTDESTDNTLENIAGQQTANKPVSQVEQSSLPSPDQQNPIEFVRDVNTSLLPQKDLISVEENNQPARSIDNKSVVRTAKIYNPITGSYIELKSESPNIEDSQEKIDLENYDYVSANETQVTNTIFTDGKVYCFQVSSWKRKSIADREERKLKRNGHNAFVVAAKPKHKRGTWYRVRIGFFTSREETEAYRDSM